MGFSFSDIGEALNPFDKSNPVFGKGGLVDEGLRGIDDKILGGDAADAAREAADIQATAAGEAKALFDPFTQLGTSGIEQAGFLTDPQAQFDFLQSNPLFQLGLENLNQQTQRSAKASGRVGATDTNQQLINNALLAASPLIQQQRGGIQDLLNLGLSTAGSQGNLLTDQAAATAGGIVGAANAEQAGIGNLLQIGSLLAGGFGGAPTPGVTP